MIVQFIGATRTVTGSMHLLHINGKNILLDCGLFQGKRADTADRNKNFPFEPSTIDALILSHAHIDHAGNLPNLVKRGYEGPIYCTAATHDLSDIMLKDSAYIQERDVEFVGKKHKKKHLPPPEPLYTIEDVAPALALFQSIPYRKSFEVVRGVQAEFVDAGHILGSASIVLTISEGGNGKSSFSHEVKFGFTGDLGRPNLPILRDPEFMGDVDALISESTYGGRYHASVDEMPQKFEEVVERTAQRGGKVIIPAFSVGRTQDLVYTMHLLKDQGRLANIPVYVDSPLSTSATEVFRKHPECFDNETLELLKKEEDPFGFQRLTYIRDVEESKKLNERTDPCIIIASSGMCEAGRIRHHLANNIGNPKNTILIVGYQADHTLGKRLVEQDKEVTIFGEVHERKCDVVVMNSFSAHADRNELMGYFNHFDRKKLKKIFLVHGDPDQAEKFSGGLTQQGFRSVEIPVRLQKFEL
ncbi:MAG TPA: MBL fold metallo-hydrolase [Bacteroidota bacterium]|nr:MBL fold metallo-hydrolase [Bacteroidota bacterium]